MKNSLIIALFVSLMAVASTQAKADDFRYFGIGGGGITYVDSDFGISIGGGGYCPPTYTTPVYYPSYTYQPVYSTPVYYTQPVYYGGGYCPPVYRPAYYGGHWGGGWRRGGRHCW